MSWSTAKPEERRGLIEEAAGTSMYKSRKLVAEKKLERTQQNLLRVSDIVREIERQIRTMELQAKKAERYRALRAELREKDFAFTAMQRDALHGEIAQQEQRLAAVENRLAEHLATLHGKEAENESVRLSLLEADKAIGAQQEDAFFNAARKSKPTSRNASSTGAISNNWNKRKTKPEIALTTVDERLRTLNQEIEELTKAKDSFIQLSLFEETFLRERETELTGLQAQIRTLQEDIDREKTALIDAANQIAYLKNDSLAKDKRQAEIAAELARCQSESSQATGALTACAERREETGQALNSCVDELRERALESTMVTASIQTLSHARDEQQQHIDGLKSEIQEHRSRLVSLEDLQRNYEGYQEGVRAIMLKKQQAISPNGVYGLVAEVIEAPESYEKALTAVLGDRLQYVIVKGHEEGIESIEFLKQQASGRGSFMPMQLRHRQKEPLPLGRSRGDRAAARHGVDKRRLSGNRRIFALGRNRRAKPDRRFGPMEPQRLLLHHCHTGRRSNRFHGHRNRRQHHPAWKAICSPSAGAFANSAAPWPICAARLPDAESEFDKTQSRTRSGANPSELS